MVEGRVAAVLFVVGTMSRKQSVRFCAEAQCGDVEGNGEIALRVVTQNCTEPYS